MTTAPRARQSVADVLAGTLKHNGVEELFLLTGGDQALWIALQEHGIRLLLGRSEQGAVYMADGYARATGRIGVAYGQHGPGAANVAAAIADAWWGGIPVLAITSSVPFAARSGFPYQYLDQQAFFAPVTKWQREVTHAEAAAADLSAAIAAALTAPTGPVHLDIPSDVIRAPVVSNRQGALHPEQPQATPPDSLTVDALAEALQSATRPVILAGAGVIRGNAWDQLRKLAEAWQIPVATTPGGKGAFPEDHPLAIGVIGRYSRKVSNEIVAGADTVLVLGSRLGSLSTIDQTVPAPSANILQVDIDSKVLAVTYPRAVPLVGDIAATLSALSAVLGGRTPIGDSGWPVLVQRRVAEWRAGAAAEIVRHAGRGIHPGAVLAALRASLAPADVVVADTGYMAAWTAALFEVRESGRTFLRAAGSLGWALPASLGASVATRGPVACVIGDGGVGYNLLELETAARLGIAVLVIVLNNRSLAFEYHDQRYHWDGRVIDEANDFTDVDYAAVARNLGAGGRRITDPAELESAMLEGLASGRPWLLDVIVDKELVAPVTNFEGVLARVI